MRSNGLMRVAAAFVVAIGVFLLGAYVQSATNAPFPPPGANPAPAGAPLVLSAGAGVRTDVPVVSTAQGAQDAARADVPEGVEIDTKRCVATMLARREPEEEARTVCKKLISGISGR